MEDIFRKRSALEKFKANSLNSLSLFRDGGFFGSVYLVPDVYCLDKMPVKTAALRHGLRYSDRFALHHGLQYIAKEFLRGD